MPPAWGTVMAKVKPLWCVYDGAEWCATRTGEPYNSATIDSGGCVHSLCNSWVIVHRTLRSKRFRVPDCPECLAKLRRRAARKAKKACGMTPTTGAR